MASIAAVQLAAPLEPEEPAVFQFPPITHHWNSVGVRAVVVNRDSLKALGVDPWLKAGNYVLLSPFSAKGEWECYVGKSGTGNPKNVSRSSGSAYARIKVHSGDASKGDWRRAIAILLEGEPVNASWFVWLEEALVALVTEAELVTSVKNDKSAGTLADTAAKATLEQVLPYIESLLRVLGYDVRARASASTSLVASGPAPLPQWSDRRSAQRIRALIAGGTLTPGDVLVHDAHAATIQENGLVVLAGNTNLSLSQAQHLAVPTNRDSAYRFWRHRGRTVDELEKTAGCAVSPAISTLASPPAPAHALPGGAAHRIRRLIDAGVLAPGDGLTHGHHIATVQRDGLVTLNGRTDLTLAEAQHSAVPDSADSAYRFWRFAGVRIDQLEATLNADGSAGLSLAPEPIRPGDAARD